MIVIANSSPLHYLVLIDCIDLLPSLFGQVLIPQAVFRELQNPHTPPKGRDVARETAGVADNSSPIGTRRGQGLDRLGDGEREAILLATARGTGVLLLIDEVKGRRVASRRKIRIIGTLGLLELAASRKLLDLPAAVDRLKHTTFYVVPELLRNCSTCRWNDTLDAPSLHSCRWSASAESGSKDRPPS